MLFTLFSPVALTIGVLLVLVGSFLLWRRIVDLQKLFKEKERLSCLKIEHSLEELRRWREIYHSEDSRYDELVRSLKQFEQQGVAL